MRYVLVCCIKGEAGKFNDNLRKDVFNKFNAKSSKLPAHFTIKAPFETNKILEMEKLLETFANNHSKTPIKLEGYGNFRRDVIFMKVNASKEAKKVHDELIDELHLLSWLEWKANEGKDKIFHCTITSKRISDRFDDIKEYVEQFPCNFDAYFDNISLFKWQNNTWVLHKEYLL